MGNLGYSKTTCDMMIIGSKAKTNREFRCSKGSMMPIVHKGIVPENLPVELPQDYCGNPEKYSEFNKCSKIVGKGLEDSFNTNCAGKNSCEIDVMSFLNLADKSEPSCVSENAKFYIQYQCKMNDQELRDMRRIGVVIAVVFLIMAAFFNLMMQYQLKTSNLLFNKWDLDTITITDYAVEMKITKEMWKQYTLDRQRDPTTKPFEAIIKEKIEKTLQRKTMGKKVEIATIHFGYRNGRVIKMLKERGLQLQMGRLEDIP